MYSNHHKKITLYGSDPEAINCFIATLQENASASGYVASSRSHKRYKNIMLTSFQLRKTSRETATLWHHSRNLFSQSGKIAINTAETFSYNYCTDAIWLYCNAESKSLAHLEEQLEQLNNRLIPVILVIAVADFRQSTLAALPNWLINNHSHVLYCPTKQQFINPQTETKEQLNLVAGFTNLLEFTDKTIKTYYFQNILEYSPPSTDTPLSPLSNSSSLSTSSATHHKNKQFLAKEYVSEEDNLALILKFLIKHNRQILFGLCLLTLIVLCFTVPVIGQTLTFGLTTFAFAQTTALLSMSAAMAEALLAGMSGLLAFSLGYLIGPLLKECATLAFGLALTPLMKLTSYLFYGTFELKQKNQPYQRSWPFGMVLFALIALPTAIAGLAYIVGEACSQSNWGFTAKFFAEKAIKDKLLSCSGDCEWHSSKDRACQNDSGSSSWLLQKIGIRNNSHYFSRSDNDYDSSSDAEMDTELTDPDQIRTVAYTWEASHKKFYPNETKIKKDRLELNYTFDPRTYHVGWAPPVFFAYIRICLCDPPPDKNAQPQQPTDRSLSITLSD